MTRLVTVSVAVAWSLAAATSLLSAAEPEKYALLVGVTTYRHAEMNRTQLKYPEADAKAVAAMLKEAGYEAQILLGEAATKQAIDEALATVGKKGNAEGVVLVGLFGHGVQYGADAYFGPYDAGVRTVVDSQGQSVPNRNGLPKLEPDPSTMVEMKSILSALAASGAGNRVLLADCCREDPSRARGRAFGSALSGNNLPPGAAALFACSEGEQAFEHDDWGHGAFTSSLLELCGKAKDTSPVIAGRLGADLRDSVERLVQDKANRRQRVNYVVNDHVDLQLRPVRPAGAAARMAESTARAANSRMERSVPTASGKKYALLVGVATYRHATLNENPLKYPEADAHAIGDRLRQSGYEVELLLGERATKTAIMEALTATKDKGTADGVSLLGFFGHGVQFEEQAYFAPYDAGVRTVTDGNGNTLLDRRGDPMIEPDPQTMIDMSTISEAIRLSPAGNRILLADAARVADRPRTRGFGARVRLADLPQSTAMIFACSEGEWGLEDDAWKHGAFVKGLLDVIAKCDEASAPDYTANSIAGPLHRRVHELVAEVTEGREHQTVYPVINGIVDMQLEIIDIE